MSDENPYTTSGPSSSASLTKTFGGGLSNASTFDWKFSAIQQMGLFMSKKFPTLDASFEEAARGNLKVSFENFKLFVDKQDCLSGLNLTVPLMQRLFSELDPHKKGFINLNDWKNAFKSFNWNEQILIELKNVAQSTFTDSDSVFSFFSL